MRQELRFRLQICEISQIFFQNALKEVIFLFTFLGLCNLGSFGGGDVEEDFLVADLGGAGYADRILIFGRQSLINVGIS